MNDLIINHIAELILPRSTDKPLKGKELDGIKCCEKWYSCH